MVEFTICHYAKNHELSRNKCPPSNLIVDTTFSSLFGSTPVPNDTSSTLDQPIRMTTAEAREAFLRNSFRKRGTLKADEPDIHTIRTPDLEPMLSKADTYNPGVNDVRLPRMHSDYRFDHSQQYNNTRNDRSSMQPEPLRMSDQRNLKPTVNKLKNQVSGGNTVYIDFLKKTSKISIEKMVINLIRDWGSCLG